MKRQIRIITVTVLFLLMTLSLSAEVCHAATSGRPDKYEVTIISVQLKDDATNQWVTIASPNAVADITGVGANTVASAIQASVVIPVGDYDNFKLVLSETMTVSGTIGASSTNSGGAVIITGLNNNADKISTWDQPGPLPSSVIKEQNSTDSITAGTAGDVSYTLDLDASDADSSIEIYIQTDLTTPISVTANSVITMGFTFDTSTALLLLGAGEMGAGAVDVNTNGALVFMPPSSGTSFTITVDGTTTTIASSDMEIEF